MKSKYIVIVSLVIAVVALLAVYHWQTKKQAETPLITDQSKHATEEASLGADIITHVQDPVGDDLPDTNPVNDAYKNPFE